MSPKSSDENSSTCRGPHCRAKIQWMVTTNSQRMPVDPDGTPHFLTCPDAATWRKLKSNGKSKGGGEGTLWLWGDQEP